MSATPALPAVGTAMVFVTSWCSYCAQLRRGLDDAETAYEVVDVDCDDEAAEFVMSVNGGNRVVPTVLFPDGGTLTNPLAEAVQARLGS